MNGVNFAGSPTASDAMSLRIHCVEVFLQAYLALAPFTAIFLPPLSTPIPCFDFSFAVIGISLLPSACPPCFGFGAAPVADTLVLPVLVAGADSELGSS
ncbi:hypothetical protein L208DRAFT_1388248 [Tricholoma matsutake]|nr:hypothetical protein L208DRAFT_1388248 [Tricholoma matsutake 945]